MISRSDPKKWQVAKKKWEKANYETITIQCKKGSRAKIYEAAKALGQSVNGFKRLAMGKAVYEAIGEPMEVLKVVSGDREHQEEKTQ